MRWHLLPPTLTAVFFVSALPCHSQAPPAAWQILFYGQLYEADAIVFCVNKSTFIDRESRWQQLQLYMVKAIYDLPPGAQFGIVFFDRGMTSFPSSGEPADATTQMKDAALNVVMTQQAGYGACSKPALLQSLSYAEQATVERKAIVFVSDGLNYCPAPDFDPIEYSNEVLDETSARNTARVPIHALALGALGQVSEAWMRELAAGNGGSYTLIDGSPLPSRFRRGDADGDGAVTVSDTVGVLTHLFVAAATPACLEAADTDDSGILDVSDAVASLNYQFLGGPAPAPPGPATCGQDANLPDLGCRRLCR